MQKTALKSSELEQTDALRAGVLLRRAPTAGCGRLGHPKWWVCTRAGAQDGSGTWREATSLAGVACRYSAAEGIPPRAPSPRRTYHLQVADQGQLRDFVRASEPGVREAASLEQRRKLSPSLSNFERVSWEEERAWVSQGRTRGDRAAQPGSRGRGDPVPRLRRACKQHLNGAAQPSAGAGPHPSDHGPGGRPRSRRGFLAATAAWGSRRPFSFIPHPASSCLYRFPPLPFHPRRRQFAL